MIKGIIFATLFIVLAVVFLMGKGDKLIAGYNTASDTEKQQVNIKRLRLLMTVMMVFTALFCFFVSMLGNERMETVLTATGIFVIVTIIFVILANTWAKKK